MVTEKPASSTAFTVAPRSDDGEGTSKIPSPFTAILRALSTFAPGRAASSVCFLPVHGGGVGEGANCPAPSANRWATACEDLTSSLRNWPVRDIERGVRLSEPARRLLRARHRLAHRMIPKSCRLFR